MIPGKIFTGFAKFQGIVSVNDFRFPRWPRCCQVLHHYNVSMIMSWFTSFTQNFVILSITKFFSSGNSCDHFGRPHDESPRTFSLSSILLGFSVSGGPCDRFRRIFSLILSLLIDAGRSVRVTASCHIDVGDAGGDESLKSLSTDQRQRMVLRCVALHLPAIFDFMWFLTTGRMAVKPLIVAEFSE